MDNCPDHDAMVAKDGGSTPHFDSAVKSGIPLGFENVGSQLKDTGKQPSTGFANSITPSKGKEGPRLTTSGGTSSPKHVTAHVGRRK